MKPAHPATATASPPALELERFLPFRVSQLASRLGAVLAAAAAERFALTPAEWRIVALLGHQPGLSASQVAQRSGLDKVAVSRAAARLVAARLLERSVEESDRRRTRLRLTTRGRDLHAELVPWALDVEDTLLGGLTPRARLQALALIDQLSKRAGQLRPARSAAPARGAQRSAGAHVRPRTDT